MSYYAINRSVPMLSWRMLQTWSRHSLPLSQRHPPRSDRIVLLELRFNFLPAAFRYQNIVHRITRITQISDICRRDGQWRRYHVTCIDGAKRTLIHDLQSGTWYLQREWFW